MEVPHAVAGSSYISTDVIAARRSSSATQTAWPCLWMASISLPGGPKPAETERRVIVQDPEILLQHLTTYAQCLGTKVVNDKTPERGYDRHSFIVSFQYRVSSQGWLA